jgi:predicted TIM-barrel fold metal-dependent hydrolase
MPQTPRSERIRSRLDHPVIDADGHVVEFLAPLEDYVREIGGSRYRVEFFDAHRWQPMDSVEERAFRGAVRPPWWGLPTENTRDRATAALPALLYERMGELGLDYTVLFTTLMGALVVREGGSLVDAMHDPEIRQIRSRAGNAYRADMCRDFADRMTPAADVPMNTPEEAITELEYVTRELGLKAISIMAVPRPIPEIQRDHPALFQRLGFMGTVGYALDTFGIDSPHDYDPFWKRCVELGVPIFLHGPGMGWTARSSPSNYTYNHIGHFAEAGEAVCKSLFMGGVTKRFPELRIAFLEGGAATGCRLYADLVGHWKKRNGAALLQRLDPRRLDRERFVALHEQYGSEAIKRHLDRVLTHSGGVHPEEIDSPETIDDFAACGIGSVEDLRDRFIPNFFFGCEADDPTNALAFRPELWPLGVSPKAIFSSDIGHWDVEAMSDVLGEAWELVEDGLLDEDDFRRFTFENAVDLMTGANPDFFEGTAVAEDVAKLRARAPQPPPPRR